MRPHRAIIGLLFGCIIFGSASNRASADSPLAACPVTLDKLQLTAITADQKQYQYHVDVIASAHEGTILGLKLESSAGPPSHVTTESFLPAETAHLTIWSPRPLTGIGIERVMRAGHDNIECSTETALADVDHADSMIGIFAVDRDLSASAFVSTAVFTDSSILRRLQPAYPVFARDQGIYGDVTVEVTVGPNGTAERVWLWRTSDNALLDEAAMNAARQTPYSAPTENGQPTSSNYLIIYKFKFSGMPSDDTLCGASMPYFHLAHSFDRLRTLYNVSTWSDNPSVISANIGFYNSQASTGLTLTLPKIAFENQKPEPRMAETDSHTAAAYAQVLWIGPEINYAVLQSVSTNTDTRRCAVLGVHALDADGHLIDVAKPDPSDWSTAQAYLVLPARYERRIFPKYPAAEASGSHGGCVNVLVHVNSDGTPDAVNIVDGSGGALNAAALDAAMASRYRLAVRDGAAQAEYYGGSYCFYASQ